MTERYFIDKELISGQTIELEGQEFHHLYHVMRERVGNRVWLINGKNTLAQANVDALQKKSATLTILSIEKSSPKHQLILAQALFRLSRLEWAIEKAVELNATAILLFPAERSEKGELSPTQKSRLHQIAISALKQCGRLDLPEIRYFSTLEDVPMTGTVWFGDPSTKSKEPINTPCTLFIGPEGGFTKEEVLSLENRGAAGVRLHPNVLRAETAAVVGLARVETGPV